MNLQQYHTVTTINGAKLPPSRARISVFDNALLCAEGLFETLLAVEDRVVFLKEHLDRLHKGAKVVGLKVPPDRRTLSAWLTTTAEMHPDRIKKLRLTVTSGESARWTGKQGPPQVIVSASPHCLPEKPLKLLVSDLRVDQRSVFRSIKTVSYAMNTIAQKRAIQRGFDDALLLNHSDKVAETTSANIYWTVRGTVFTTPLATGCLEGTTRKHVFRKARQLGLPIVEKTVSLSMLLKADEIFLSSSLKLVAGVDQIMYGRKRSSFKVGDITRLLSEQFRRFIHV
ncbi:MAG: hypothetical protein DRP45_01750 [Candidatus Zixiibacteriota bacterium]|nr:MAG: hypothetical protein DRP45_01750 [candidate division Zixibacteria bacterium]